MSGPIKKGQIDQAPTPQNTPASAAGSYMPKGGQPSIPSTIDENETLKGLLANNPLLLASIQEKLGHLIGTNSGYVDSLSKNVKYNLYGLKSLQEKQYEIEAEFQADLLQLERKYNELYKPIFQKRKDLIIGTSKPTEEEAAHGKTILDAEEGVEDDEDDEEKKIEELDSDGAPAAEEEKGVPYFWLTAMQNLPPIADMISDRDVEVLEHLVDIRKEYMDKPGFKLIFEFSENDFFSNKQLIKTYYYQKELGYTGEFVYDHAEGCEIDWTDNAHNVTVDIELRKQRNKHTKQVRTIEKTTPAYSFFNFFTPPSMPDEDDEGFEEIDDELEESLQNDYSVGELIKEKLIPRAVDWFTGHALNYESELAAEAEEEFEDEDDDDDAEDGDDDDDDDDDDNDEDGNDGKEKPECKQQ